VNANHISETAEARVIRFCTRYTISSSRIWRTNRSYKGVVRVTWPIFNYRGPQWYLERL